MNYSRLQQIHFDGASKGITRQDAIDYIERLTNPMVRTDMRFDESLIGEPIVVTYLDANNNRQVMVGIGSEGEVGEGVLTPYHIIDSAHLEEDIQALSGSTEDIRQALQNEILRAIEAEQELQNELDATQTGAGLNENGNYVKNTDATYIPDATSLNDADKKLDEELARVEQARKDVTGQNTDEYVPNPSYSSRPLDYIADATSLNDADIKLDQGIQALNAETVKNIVVNDVTGTVTNNVAEVTIVADDINIGEYEHYTGQAEKSHKVKDDYSVLDAIKQIDLNLEDYSEKETAEREGIHIIKITTDLGENIREAYQLVNKDGLPMSGTSRIDIYKDSALYDVYLGHVDDTLHDYSSPVVTSGTGDTALCFIYFKSDGYYQLVPINVEKFLEEAEFLDGFRVDNHQVYVRIDAASEEFLTVSPSGVKLSGVQNAINNAVADEEQAREDADNAIQAELDATQTGAGLNADGSYNRHNTQGETNYINSATSLDNADVILDKELGRVEQALGEETQRAEDAEEALHNEVVAETERAMAAENSISGDVTTLSGAVENLISGGMADIQAELDTTQTGAGLNADGTYHRHNTQGESYYIHEATSLDGADLVLDRELNSLSSTTELIKDNLISETQARTNKDNELQEELDATQVGAGLNADGSYEGVPGTYYIREATSLKDADIKLDNSLHQLSGAVESIASSTEGAIAAEVARATAAENSISGDVTTLSASTISEIDRVDDRITNEVARATESENSISGNVTTLSATVATLSANTDTKINNEIQRAVNRENELEAAITKASVSSLDKTITIETASTIGTDLSVNIDGVTIAKNANGVLSTKLSVQKLTTPSAANVKEEYALVDNNGTYLGDTIKVYKDASLQSVELVNVGGKEYRRFTYILADGTTSTVDLDVSEFLSENEFKDGLTVNDSKVYVLIDPTSETFLTVSSNGVKLSGVQNAINNAVNEEKQRAMSAETQLQTNINTERTERQNADTLLNNAITAETAARQSADSTLQNNINDEQSRATARENELNNAITAETAARQSADTVINNAISAETSARQSADNTLDGKITTEKDRAMAAENEIRGLISDETLARQNAVSTLTNSLNQEITRAQGVEAQIQNSLSNEVTRAQNAETQLQNAITAEATSRANADTQLQTAITNEIANRQTAIESLTEAYTEADNNIITAYTAAIVEERTSRIDTDERLERMIGTLSASTGSDIAELSSSTITINNNLNSVSGSVITLSSSTVNIKNDVTKLISSAETINTNLNQLSGSVITLSSSTVNINNNVTTLSSTTVSIQSGLTQVSGTVINHENRITNLETGLTQVSGTVVNIQSGLTQLSGTVRTNETNIQTLSGNLVTLSSSTVNIQSGLTQVSGSVTTLSSSTVNINNNLTTLSTNTQTAITDINNRLDSLSSKSVAGKQAIQVANGTGASSGVSEVSLLINGADKVLSQDNSGLLASVSIELSNDSKHLYLKGKNGVTISDIDTSDFVKDGMLDSVTFDTTTKTLKFVFNTDSGKSQIDVPLGALVDIYTVSGGSETYMVISDYKVGLKVDVAGGLASYSALTALSAGTVAVKNDLTQLSGSVISLSGTVVNIQSGLTQLSGTVRTNETNIQTLSGNLQTLSSSTVNIQSGLTQLSGSVTTLSGNVNTLSGNLVTLSSSTVNIQSGLTQLSGSVTTLSGSVVTLSGNLQTLSSTTVSIQSGLTQLSGTVINHENRITNVETGLTQLSGTVVTVQSGLTQLSGSVNTFSSSTVNEINGLKERVTTLENENTLLKERVTALEQFINNIDNYITSAITADIYAAVKTAIVGTTGEIAVTPNDSTKKLTIGFDDPVYFGNGEDYSG